MPETPAIVLHAELLPNIRQLTLHVSLPISPSDVDIRESTITLSESCRAITVFVVCGNAQTKRETVETLKLPVRVNASSRRNLSFAGHRLDNEKTENDSQSAEYSFRLQVDQHDTAPTSKIHGIQEDDYIPWTAKDMATCLALHCRFCRQLIIDTSKSDSSSWQWKDLPSGNWAEMMDFWHCHKPDVPADEREGQRVVEEQSASTKGYGASNRVIASPRTVLVDVASFLVARNDCHNVKVLPRQLSLSSSSSRSISHEEQKMKVIACFGCGATLGREDPIAEGLRLYKNNISARYTDLDAAASVHEQYAVDIITSAQLLDLIDHEGIRRFVIHSGQLDGIMLWVFNPDLRYSSSSADHSIIGKRAIKVLYQNVSDVEAILEPENGKPASLSLEELFLPENIYNELIDSLKHSHHSLPASARVFREWNVALLDRLEKDTSLSGYEKEN